MTDIEDLDPATLRSIANELSAVADSEAEMAYQNPSGHADDAARSGLGPKHAYLRGFAGGFLVSFLTDKATELRDRALRIEMGREAGQT